MLLVDVTAPSRHDPIAVAARLAVDSFEGAGQGGVGQGGGGQASGGSSLPLFLKNQGVAHSNACVVQQILSLRQPLQLVPWRTAQVGHMPPAHYPVSITTTAHYHCSLPGFPSQLLLTTTAHYLVSTTAHYLVSITTATHYPLPTQNLTRR